jgi:hypothetical protein
MKKCLWLITIVAVSALAGIAAAQQKTPPKNLCEQDGATYCASSKNLRDFLTCLKENKASLTEACRAQLDIALAAGKKMHKSCDEETKRVCKTLGPKAAQCISQNLSKFSRACQKDTKDWRRTVIIVPAHLRKK